MSNVFISENDPSRPAIWISWIFEDCLYCLHLCLFCHSCPGETSNSSNSTIQLMILCRGRLRSFACSFILNWSCLCWMIKRQPFLGFRATSPSSSSSSWLVLRRDELLWLAGGHQVVWTSYDKKVFSQHHLSPGIPILRRSARPTGDFWVS